MSVASRVSCAELMRCHYAFLVIGLFMIMLGGLGSAVGCCCIQIRLLQLAGCLNFGGGEYWLAGPCNLSVLIGCFKQRSLIASNCVCVFSICKFVAFFSAAGIAFFHGFIYLEMTQIDIQGFFFFYLSRPALYRVSHSNSNKQSHNSDLNILKHPKVYQFITKSVFSIIV